jgi:hypothetical protein
MQRFILAAVLAVSPAAASAQYDNAQRYGNTTYYNGSNGYRGTAQTYGNQTYYNDNRGTNCTMQRYGNQTYTSCY